MTLRELADRNTIQGNIELKVWGNDEEVSSYRYADCEDFWYWHCKNANVAAVADLEISYIYASVDKETGNSWLVIELIEEV